METGSPDPRLAGNGPERVEQAVVRPRAGDTDVIGAFHVIDEMISTDHAASDAVDGGLSL